MPPTKPYNLFPKFGGLRVIVPRNRAERKDWNSLEPRVHNCANCCEAALAFLYGHALSHLSNGRSCVILAQWPCYGWSTPPHVSTSLKISAGLLRNVWRIAFPPAATCGNLLQKRPYRPFEAISGFFVARLSEVLRQLKVSGLLHILIFIFIFTIRHQGPFVVLIRSEAPWHCCLSTSLD